MNENNMSYLDEFKKDLEENKKGSGEKAAYFKLKNGDNKIVLLTDPVGFSEVFGIGIAYEGCGYAQFAGRRYKCYVLDMVDGQVKLANFSYTTAKKILALSEGARTKFEKFPMPYIINLKTDKAGTKEVETDVLADEDYESTENIQQELESYAPVRDIIERSKEWQKKQVESDPVLQQKIEDFLAKKDKENQERMQKRNKPSGNGIPDGTDVIEYPEEEVDVDSIPF